MTEESEEIEYQSMGSWRDPRGEGGFCHLCTECETPCPEDWADRAACKGTPLEWWFPAPNNGTPTKAKAVCETCPVRQPCLNDALAQPYQEGYAGGMSGKDRLHYRWAIKKLGESAIDTNTS